LRDNLVAVPGPSKLLGFIDHDSLKTKGKDEYARFLRREGTRDYYRRNIVNGFLDAFRSSLGGSYIQFLPNPSNRRTISGVRVTPLNAKQAEAALLKTIEAQRKRPDPAFNPKLANDKHYTKKDKNGVANWQKFKIPGLSGILITDKRTNAQLLEIALKHHATRSKELHERFYSEIKQANTPVDISKLEYMAEHLKFLPSSYVKDKVYTKALRKAKKAKQDTTKMVADRAKVIEEMTAKMLDLFYINHTVNQYALSQWLYGDEAFFASKEVETKRIQVATATSKKVLVDEKYGLPLTSRVGVFADIKTTVPELEGMRKDSLGDSFDSTDAEGFMLPSFYSKLASAAGIESDTDIVLKPVYYAIKDGIPTAIKYSAKVLTDELTSKFPHLRALRDFMESNKLDQMVAESAVKVGTPKTLLKTDEFGLIDPMSFDDKAIITIDNEFLGLQLNPAHAVETSVANPSQGTSVINTNGQNEAETAQLYDLNSLVIDLGLRDLTRRLKLTRKGTLTQKSLFEIRRALLKTAESIPGNRDLYYLLSHKDENGRYDVPMSLPLIANKVISNLSSIFSKDSVAFRFAGSKLVLQSDVGTRKFYDDEGNLVDSSLKFKDEEGYTEVFLPHHYREFFSTGDKIQMSGKGKDAMVGFRIPSSNYHSLLAIKVKGFYPAPTASEGNIVIAPSPIVYYHGSDYDVDTLFIIRKELQKEATDLQLLVAEVRDTTNLDLSIAANEVIGFKGEESHRVEGKYLHYFLEDIIILYDQKIETLRANVLNQTLTIQERKQLNNQLDVLTDSAKKLTDIARTSAKNHIVSLFSENLRDPKNRTDLLTPISFEQVASLKSRKVTEENVESLREADDSLMEMWAKLEAEKRGVTISEFPTQEEVDELIYPEGELTDFLTQGEIKSNTDSGGMGIGIAANTLGAVARAFSQERITSIKDTTTGEIFLEKSLEAQQLLKANKATDFENLIKGSDRYVVETRATPKLRPPTKGRSELDLRVDGHKLSEFRRKALNLETGEVLTHNGYDVNIFETFDTIENLAIDNVKEQKLFILGFNNNNANAFLSALAFGIPLKNVSKIFRTPFIEGLFSAGRIYDDKYTYHFDDMINELATSFLEDRGAFEKGLTQATNKPSLFKSIENAYNAGNDLKATLKVELSKVHTYSAILDGVYTGKITGVAKMVSDYAALNNVFKLSQIGQQLFKHAQILSMLKRYPNSKHKIDGVLNAVDSLVEFEATEQMHKQIFKDYGYKLREHLAATSQEYIELAKRDQAAADSYLDKLMRELKNSDLYAAMPTKLANASFTNALLRRSIAKRMVPTSSNIFEDNNILRMPHVFSAYRGLVQLKALIENTFAMHYPEVREFAEHTLDRSRLYVLPFKRYQTIERIQENYLNFISSGMTLYFGDNSFELSIKDTTINEEQWTQSFVSRFQTMAAEHPNNLVLNSTEIITSDVGVKSLAITADKVKNEESVERLRDSFRELMRIDHAFALDWFKYALITKGLFFDRTSFSLLFPESWAVAYGKSLNDRLETLVPRDNPAYTRHTAKILADEFLFQYLRRKQESLRYVSGISPKEMSEYVDAKGYTKKVLSGTDVFEDRTIHFDLKFLTTEGTPDFIRTFDKAVYAKHATWDGASYYRKIAMGSKDNLLKFNINSLQTGALSLAKLLDPSIKVIDSASIVDGKLRTGEALEIGTEFYIHNMNEASPRSLTKAKVTARLGDFHGLYQFKWKNEGSYSITNSELIEASAADLAPLQSADNARAAIVGNASASLRAAKNSARENAIALVRLDQMTDPAKSLGLDIKDVSELSDELLTTYVLDIEKKIASIPNNTLVYISQDLLTPLMENSPSIAQRFAQAIFNKTKFALPILNEDVQDTVSATAKLMIKRATFLKAVLSNPVHMVKTGDAWTIDIKAAKADGSIMLGTIRDGDSIGIGKDGLNKERYAYVFSVEKGIATVIPYSEEVFESMTETNYSSTDFMALATKKTKC
jgi:hypothetical protein